MYPDESFINSSTCFTLSITLRKDYTNVVYRSYTQVIFQKHVNSTRDQSSANTDKSEADSNSNKIFRNFSTSSHWVSVLETDADKDVVTRWAPRTRTSTRSGMSNLSRNRNHFFIGNFFRSIWGLLYWVVCIEFWKCVLVKLIMLGCFISRIVLIGYMGQDGFTV